MSGAEEWVPWNQLAAEALALRLLGPWHMAE